MTQENSEIPWYQDGLKFKCTQCGNCCTGAPGAVWVDEQEIQDIADTLEVSIGEIRLMHTRQLRGKITLNEFPNGDCTFFDPEKRGCKIYNARPKQCRTWPFWNSNINTERDWNNLKTECPGINTGNLYSLEIIQQQAAQIDI